MHLEPDLRVVLRADLRPSRGPSDGPRGTWGLDGARGAEHGDEDGQEARRGDREGPELARAAVVIAHAGTVCRAPQAPLRR